jgi:hypothetical protein
MSDDVEITQDAPPPPRAVKPYDVRAIARVEQNAGPIATAFVPNSMGEMMALAEIMSQGIGVPPQFRGQPANVLVILNQALRWGLDPFAVASKAYFVNDRVAYESQLIAAVVNGSPLLDGRLKIEWDGEGDALKCRVSGRIRGESEDRVRIVSIAKARKSNGSPLWEQDPHQQLAYYTQRAWARLYTPEILMGVYTPDELGATVEPDKRIEAGSTPRRGGGTGGGSVSGDRLNQARAAGSDGFGTGSDAVDTAAMEQGTPAAAEQVIDQDAGGDDPEWISWSDEEWHGWRTTAHTKMKVATSIDKLNAAIAPMKPQDLPGAPNDTRELYATRFSDLSK